MSKPIKRYYRLFAIGILGTLVFAVLVPQMIKTIKTRYPFKSYYLRYSKWRYDWRSASEMGDGKSSLEIIIEGPMGIAEDDSGNIFISDREARFVWKVEPSGRATVIAGTGRSTGSNGLSRTITRGLEVDFASPEGLVVDKNGNILLADSFNHVIIKLDREGNVSHLVGNGQRGFNGDGKPALEASLANPYDVRLDSKGNVYIADVLNHRIRKVGLDGLITTVAGTGVPGYAGDGGPATDAQLNTPYGILIDKWDNLLIADSDNHVIRKVGKDGIINTIAGSGRRGYKGDGDQALAAEFDSPQSLAMDEQGRLFIGDEHNNAIRIIQLDGTVGTLVGARGPGFSGDGGKASVAQIADPENLCVLKNGSLLISVRDNSRVRIVHPNGIIGTFAGRGPTAKHRYYAPIRLSPVMP